MSDEMNERLTAMANNLTTSITVLLGIKPLDEPGWRFDTDVSDSDELVAA